MGCANTYYDTEMKSHEIDDRTFLSVHKTPGDLLTNQKHFLANFINHWVVSSRQGGRVSVRRNARPSSRRRSCGAGNGEPQTEGPSLE